MATPTGFKCTTANDINNDIANIYETNFKTNTTTTNFKSSNYGNVDLGNVFAVYSNLTNTGFTGTVGNLCNYKYSGTDIGSSFVAKGSIIQTDPTIVYNGNFLIPLLSSGTRSSIIPSGWLYTGGGGGKYLVNGISTDFYKDALPSGVVQYCAIQQNNVSGTSKILSKQIYLTQSNLLYTLSFYASPRNAGYGGTYYSTNQKLSVSLVQNSDSSSISLINQVISGNFSGNLTTGLVGITKSFGLNTCNFNISSTTFYVLNFTYSITDNTDSTWLLGNVVISPSVGSLTFNGSTQYAALGSASYFGTTDLSAGGTVETWFKVPASNTQTGFMAIAEKTGEFGVFVYNNYLTVYDWVNSATYSDTTVPVNDSNWHHAAIVFTPGSVIGNTWATNSSILYRDGALALNYTMGYTSQAATYSLAIASGSSASAYQPFNGGGFVCAHFEHQKNGCFYCQ